MAKIVTTVKKTDTTKEWFKIETNLDKFTSEELSILKETKFSSFPGYISTDFIEIDEYTLRIENNFDNSDNANSAHAVLLTQDSQSPFFKRLDIFDKNPANILKGKKLIAICIIINASA